VSSLPSRAEALEVLRKTGCSDEVVRHSILVAEIAKEIISSLNPNVNVDVHLVEAGALLHDIGRSLTHGVQHGSVGAQLLERLGYPDSLVDIARNHVGAGIPRKEAIALGLPPIDHLPKTVEEKLVCYADKLAWGSVRVQFEKALEALAKDLGSDHPSIARLRCLHQEIMELTGGVGNESHPSRKDSARKRQEVPERT